MTTPVTVRRRYSHVAPAPDAVRCVAAGCWRKRHPNLAGRCEPCHKVSTGRKPTRDRAERVKVKWAEWLTLATDLDAEVIWAGPGELVRDGRLSLPAGVRLRLVAGAASDESGAVVELPCGGRLVVPPSLLRPP